MSRWIFELAMEEQNVLTVTHDAYQQLMHSEYTRIIKGRKHAMTFDGLGRPHWTPVLIERKEGDDVGNPTAVL